MRLRVARIFLVAVALATSAGLSGTPSASASTFTIVDTLAPATPTTTFSLFGSSGYTIIPSQIVGPRFTLTDTTVVTEIGGFIDMFGFPPPAAEVQIRPEVGGIPGDPVLATFVMSNDGDMFTISYESASPNLVLGAGTYFAMFAPQGDAEGFLLGFASDPFVYQPGVTTLAFGSQVGDAPAAVRILGQTANAHDLLVNLLAVVDAGPLGPGSSFHAMVANALAQTDAGNTTAACNTLGAFVQAVSAQIGRSLTLEQANELIADAQSIRGLLGC
jgi:hypothetical protein